MNHRGNLPFYRIICKINLCLNIPITLTISTVKLRKSTFPAIAEFRIKFVRTYTRITLSSCAILPGIRLWKFNPPAALYYWNRFVCFLRLFDFCIKIVHTFFKLQAAPPLASRSFAYFSSWLLLDRASSSSANFHPSSIIISHQTHSRSFAPCGSPIRQHVQPRVISKGLLTVRFVLVLDIPLNFLIFIAWSLYFLGNKLINHFFILSVM